MNSLAGKNILLFITKFFNYDITIKEGLRSLGANVHLYDERGNASAIRKILLRKARFLLTAKINSYYRRIVDTEINFAPDFILFISPEMVNKQSLLYMKRCFPKTKFILYMWDSMENANAKQIYKYFDKCFTFDTIDSKNYGFIFRPLFFVKEFENIKREDSIIYDFAFIGSVHSDRAKVLNSLMLLFEKNNLNYYYYIYVQGKLMYCLYYLLDKNFRSLAKRHFTHLKSLSYSAISEIVSNANYIIDINHPKQTGLTMRTIEMLGAHKKLVTTNLSLKDYDFYNVSNQIVIDRNNIVLDTNLLIHGYIPINDQIYQKYSLIQWLTDIFQ